MKILAASLPSPFSLALRLGFGGGLARVSGERGADMARPGGCGNYPESWNTAAAISGMTVPQAGWVSKVGAVRVHWAL